MKKNAGVCLSECLVVLVIVTTVATSAYYGVAWAKARQQRQLAKTMLIQAALELEEIKTKTGKYEALQRTEIASDGDVRIRLSEVSNSDFKLVAQLGSETGQCQTLVLTATSASPEGCWF